MKREFDHEAYGKALQDFIVRSEQVSDEKGPEIGETIGILADFLRLGGVDITIYEDEVREQEDKGVSAVLYREENRSEELLQKRREVIGNQGIFHYILYQRKGEEPWNPEEEERIQVFVNLLNIFNRRIISKRRGQYYASHEPDFGMYNVPFFLKRIGECSARCITGGFSACYFNIRRLSNINEEYGRDGGTKLVKAFLRGLEKLLTRREELICRIGGDNFAVLFDRENEEAVLNYLNGVYVTADGDKEPVLISAWVGVYRLNPLGEDPANVMDNVAFAVKIAKMNRSLKPVYFDEKLMGQFEENKRIQFLFAKAIEKEEFLVYYQPKVVLKGYQLGGAEALCRWRHHGEMILPYKFIPVFEQSHRICQLDFYMLDHVCRDIRRWLDEGRKVVRISVNLSRRHFGDENLLEHILEIIDRNRVPHKYIEIELTETSMDVKFTELKALVEGLRQNGIHTAVDDFGSGYSSLNLIRELPWDVLKLDKTFLDFENQTDSKAQMMFGHVVSMAREMGMECITEGVETLEQIRFLKENNCFLAQGYYFDKPMPVEEFEMRLAAYDNERGGDLRPMMV